MDLACCSIKSKVFMINYDVAIAHFIIFCTLLLIESSNETNFMIPSGHSLLVRGQNPENEDNLTMQKSSLLPPFSDFSNIAPCKMSFSKIK